MSEVAVQRSESSGTVERPAVVAPDRADVAISVRDLGKLFFLPAPAEAPARRFTLRSISALLRGGNVPTGPGRDLWALHGVSFDVKRGERLAIIGRNGAGKSTLLKILSRVIPPTRGEIRIRGRVTALLEVGVGFSNQLTGRENIFVNASLHGLSRRETAERLDQIVEFSGIDPRFLDTKLKYYSSGMRVRLAFSVAAHLDPDVLLLDEVLAVGDMTFQEKCLERVDGLVRERRTLLFVSHDMSAVARFCQRAIWLEQGRILVDGPAKEVAALYLAEMKKTTGGTRVPARSKPANEATRNGRAGHSSPRALSAPADGEAIPPPAEGALHEGPVASLVSVRVVDRDLRDLKAVTVDQTWGVEFVYDVAVGGEVVLQEAHFYRPDGTHLFTVVCGGQPDLQQPKAPGRYASILWVPAHLLNVGTIDISVGLATPGGDGARRHDIVERALSVEVFEAPFGAPSSRGPYREVKGVVRPLCEWETRQLR